jgi:hypothetical protein
MKLSFFYTMICNDWAAAINQCRIWEKLGGGAADHGYRAGNGKVFCNRQFLEGTSSLKMSVQEGSNAALDLFLFCQKI